MHLNIDHYPDRTFKILPCTPFLNIDLNESVKKKLKEGEVLTNATALKILKQIKLKSDVLSFLTKPIVLISLSTVIMIAGSFIPVAVAGAAAVVLIAAQVLVVALGASIFGYTVENYFNDFLPQISEAYRDQSQRAADYIQRINSSNQEFVFHYA